MFINELIIAFMIWATVHYLMLYASAYSGHTAFAKYANLLFYWSTLEDTERREKVFRFFTNSMVWVILIWIVVIVRP